MAASAATFASCVAAEDGTSTRAPSEKSTMAKRSFGPSASTSARAASLARSSLEPLIEPERSRISTAFTGTRRAASRDGSATRSIWR